MPDEQKWPSVLWLVRHGQSAGNVARETAEATRQPIIDLPMREVDVPLSPLGESQARALGQWFAALPEDNKPTIVLSSPYLRARETARLALGTAGMDLDNDVTFVTDERLREKEFGVFDRLTKEGVEQKYPEQAAMRTVLGKFYHRPPGGESWCDVILRLRSVIDSMTRDYRAERVLVVCHQVIVSCFRYLLERMSEEEIMDIDSKKDVANCSITSYEFDSTLGRHGKLALKLFNFVVPLEEAGTTVTRNPDAPGAMK